MRSPAGDRGERWPDDRAWPDAGPRRRPGPPAGENDQYRGPGSWDGSRRRPHRRPARRAGLMPGRFGVVIVIACAGLGAVLTALTGGQPGTLLGVFLIVGTLTAGTLVRPGAVHLIIPVPALAYLVAASLAGIVSIPASNMSKTGLAVSALQWIAHGFLVMVIATAAAIAITVIRRRAAAHHPARLRAR